MLQINFDDLARKYPQLKGTWVALSHWFSSNPTKRFIEVALLRSDIPSEVDDQSLAIALDILRTMKVIERVFRLRAPDGIVLNGEYSSLTNLPEHVSDRFGRTLPMDPKSLQPVAGYRWGAA